MNHSQADINERPQPDPELTAIADYVSQYSINSPLAYETAYYCLIDSLGCAMLALRYPECSKHLGPIVPNTVVQNGVPVPGTAAELDPVKAAFDIGTLVRWLDYNDTWLAAEWGHPSDNLGAILAVADYVSRERIAQGKQPLTMRDVLTAMIKAHEIQGIFALQNSFNRVGLDHVILVKLASAAVIMPLLSSRYEDIINVISQVFVDGQSLRTYRHAPNTGSRKSWAAGDATSRAVRLALMTRLGEMGYPSALTAKNWGFYDVTFKNRSFEFPQAFGSYVMENILFKIAFPAEFHAQTAVECAIQLHAVAKHKLDAIDKITLYTQEPAIRIISKTGPLHNPADRDHCLQYMVAIGLIEGNLTADAYEESAAKNPLIDELRKKMHVVEDPAYTEAYYDPQKRAIPNAIQISFKDGTQTEKVEVLYPIGHKLRRSEGIPLLKQKFVNSLATRFSRRQQQDILSVCQDQVTLEKISVPAFMDLWKMG